LSQAVAPTQVGDKIGNMMNSSSRARLQGLECRAARKFNSFAITGYSRQDCIDVKLSAKLDIDKGRLERFPAKWAPVRVKKTRQIKNLELRSDSIGTGL